MSLLRSVGRSLLRVKQIVEMLFERKIALDFQLSRIRSYGEQIGFDLLGRGCLAKELYWNRDAGAGIADTR